jgi:cytochrome c-type biogenesis protein CcmH
VNRFVFALLFALCVGGEAFSQKPADPVLEKRVMGIASELRCLVCQNQTLADSNAELAVDLRNSIREQLGRGASEREVLDFMVARYGDFVLYRPPLKATTVLLWGGPFLFLGFGILILVRRLLRKRPQAQPMSEEERARAAQLLGSGNE